MSAADSLELVNRMEAVLMKLEKYEIEIGTVLRLFDNKKIDLEDGKVYSRAKQYKTAGMPKKGFLLFYMYFSKYWSVE